MSHTTGAHKSTDFAANKKIYGKRMHQKTPRAKGKWAKRLQVMSIY